MKAVRFTTILFIITTTIFSCKKDNSQGTNATVKLGIADTGKIVAVSKGQTISVTLENPGDGGYSFNAWQYDNTVLNLNSHTHINPTNTNVAGDFGTDVWVFSTLKTGSSAVLLTASRGSATIVTSLMVPLL